MDLTIAVLGPLAGPEARVARPWVSAVRAAVQRHGPTFGGRMGVRTLDDCRDPGRTLTLIGRLIDDPDVVGVVGPKNSGGALAVREFATEAGLPLLLPAATADELAGPGLLRLCAPDAATARAAAELALDLDVRGLWVEADATPYGSRLATAVRAATAQVGITLTEHIGEADAAFLAMGEVEQARRMGEHRRADFRGHLMGAEGGPGAAIGMLAGDAAEGAWQLYAGTPVPAQTHVYTAEAVAATEALLHAYEATMDRTAISAWLRSRDRGTLPSIFGPLSFDATGQRERARVSVWRIQRGRAVRQPARRSVSAKA